MKIKDEKIEALIDGIINYRAKYDLTQEEFAKQCGLTKQTINAIELGKRNITALTFAKISQLLERG